MVVRAEKETRSAQEKKKNKRFSPPRRKGRQEIRARLLLLSFLAVKILGIKVLQERQITDEVISITVADTSGSVRYVGKSKISLQRAIVSHQLRQILRQ